MHNPYKHNIIFLSLTMPIYTIIDLYYIIITFQQSLKKNSRKAIFPIHTIIYYFIILLLLISVSTLFVKISKQNQKYILLIEMIS